MANPQDRPDYTPDAAPVPHADKAVPPPAAPADKAVPPPPPPPTETPLKPAQQEAKKTPAKKAPAKAAKKAQKATAKKAPASKVPAKKAAEKKPAAKKPAAKKAPPARPEAPDNPAAPQLADTDGNLSTAAKEAAAQAKSTVDRADNPVSPNSTPPSAGRSPLPLAVAVAISLLALLLARQLRRRG